MARNLEVLVRITGGLDEMAQAILRTDGTASPTVYHFARTVVRLYAKGKPIQRRYAKGVAKFFYENLGMAQGACVADALANARHARLNGYTSAARNYLANARKIRLNCGVTIAQAAAQLATLVSVNAARIAALHTGYSAQVLATAATFYRATAKLANAKKGSHDTWRQWHYAVTVDAYALNDQLVDDAILHLRTMPHWSALCRTVAAKFGLTALCPTHPVLLLGHEL